MQLGKNLTLNTQQIRDTFRYNIQAERKNDILATNFDRCFRILFDR